ncbi:phage tail assembly chaperone G [Halalkalibacterium ligniniphilum]|uniref:phage tail assembly chaperone G n=1 Tax=Halalkalibacterium ligniniphilum TaxID=1134413 RepID=UPI000349AA26|nr:hypothetical protein [Halalkalibacterium ligniniphilum]
MKIELYIDGEKKLFMVPFVPMLAKRKYLEIEAKKEEKGDATSGYTIDEFDEMCTILTDVVFQKQFTLEQLIAGASEEYANEKLLEAVFGIKPERELREGEEGNEKGE